MKRLKLKGDEGERCADTMTLPDETFQTIAEAAFKAPEQRDAFSGDILPENAGKLLKAYIERLQRLKGEAKAITEDAAEVMKEAEGQGFDKVVIKDVLKLLDMDNHDRERRLSTIETYLRAIGEPRPGM